MASVPSALPTAVDAAPTPRAGTYAWYVAVVLSLAHLVSFIDRFVMSLMLAPIKATFGASDFQLGLLQGVGFVILYCIAAIPLGRIVDVGHRRGLIVTGILFWSAATAACGLARNFETLFTARIAVGLGEACLVPAALSLITAYFPGRSLGRAVSVFSTGATLGASTALIGGGALLGWLATRAPLAVPGLGPLAPWQSLFVIAALPGLVAAGLLMTVREPARKISRQDRPGLAAALGYVRANGRAYVLHVGATCAVVVLYQALTAWSPTFLIRRFGLSIPQSGFLIGGLLLFAGPAGNLIGGALTDRFHAAGKAGAPGLTIALALAAAVVPGAVFCLSPHLATAMIAWTLLLVCVSAGVPAALAGVQVITPDRFRGTISALFLASYTLVGVGLGPTLVGLLTDRVFRNEQQIWLSLLCIVIAVPLVGVVLAMLGRKPMAASSVLAEGGS